MSIYIGGMSINDLIRMGNSSYSTVTTVNGQVISSSSQFAQPAQDVPTQKFGAEKISNINVGLENLIFEGTSANRVSTHGNIDMNQAKIQDVFAKGCINASGSTIGNVKSDSSLNLDDCTFTHAKCNGGADISNCNTTGFVQSNGSLSVSNCTSLSGKANGSLSISNSHKLDSFKANGSAQIMASTIGTVKANGSLTVSNSTLGTVEYSGSLTISGSTVEDELIVNSPNSSCGIMIINGRRIEQNASAQITTIYLNNTTINNINFVGHQGKVVLRGTSQVTGTITNGSIIPSRV